MADSDLQADLLGPELATELEEYAQGQQLLLSAAQHDLDNLRTLLKTVPVDFVDTETGYTALHSAIASLAPGAQSAVPNGDSNGTATSQRLDNAEQTLKVLFQNGAIWNDLDENNETPGCLALRLNLHSLYEIVVDAGVRAELLLNRLDDFAPLMDTADDDDDEDDEEAIRLANEAQALETTSSDQANGSDEQALSPTDVQQQEADDSTKNVNYLSSSLSFTADRILDASANGVMMSWESSLMQRTASKILPSPGLKVLNIGHGMGIIDTFIQDEHEPAEHHIIDAHPDVLTRMKETGWDPETSTYKYRNVTVHAGTWQELLPALISNGLTFDAIFFDTFAEDYKAFREFFSEYVIGLLSEKGRWSFFHGLGADRQVCYDVYTKVVEMDLFEAGFEVEWEDVELPELKIEGDGDGQWEGVKRSYFSVEKYRLPVCRFIG